MKNNSTDYSAQKTQKLTEMLIPVGGVEQTNCPPSVEAEQPFRFNDPLRCADADTYNAIYNGGNSDFSSI